MTYAHSLIYLGKIKFLSRLTTACAILTLKMLMHPLVMQTIQKVTIASRTTAAWLALAVISPTPMLTNSARHEIILFSLLTFFLTRAF